MKRLGLRERVVIFGKKEELQLVARIDTGASKCSIDAVLAKKLGIDKPVIGRKVIKTAHGARKRNVVKAKLKIAGRKMNVQFTLADRKKLKYDVLIGRNVLRKGFIIDPGKKL